MACSHRTPRRNCKSCSTRQSNNGCSEEQMAYLLSQEWVTTVMANMQITDLKTADRTFIGALLEFDKILEHKLDKTPATEYIASKSLQHVQALFTGAGTP